MPAKQYDTPPALQIETNRSYTISIETDRGAIELELFPQHAPKTVNNFVFLAQDGCGGPGYRFEDEFKGNPLRHERGVISMANSGPGTNGSQFFITHGPQPHLDGKHTVFGKVTKGIDVVDAIEQGDTMRKITVT